MTKIDFMKRAIDLSIQNIKNNGGPFGCVIVKDNYIIGKPQLIELILIFISSLI